MSALLTATARSRPGRQPRRAAWRGGRLGFVCARLAQTAVVLLGISVLVFFMIHMIPGDPARTMLGQKATAQSVAALHRSLGLDQPLPVQYGRFLLRLLHGDLGDSLYYQQPSLDLIGQRIGATVSLMVMGTVFALLISVPLAVLAATRRGRLSDHLVRAVPMIGLGMPSFWVGLMLMLLFGITLGWFPLGGYGSGLLGHLRSLVLPGLTVALAMSPPLIRSLRAALVDCLGAEYITTARSKGIAEMRVLVRHALRNALVSSVSVIAINISGLLGSSVVIENVFGLPGLGGLMVTSIFNRDFAVVQAVTLVFAVMVVTVNLLADLAYSALDPRVVLR